MDFAKIVELKSDVTSAEFWNAINVWLHSPHTVNRRILTSVHVSTIEVEETIANVCWRIRSSELSPFFLEETEEVDTAGILNALRITDSRVPSEFPNSLRLYPDKTYLRVAKLLPRNKTIFSPTIEFTFIRRDDNFIVSCHRPISSEKKSLAPAAPYKIHYDRDGSTSISLYSSNDVKNDPSGQWLKDKLFPRLIKWMRKEPGTVRSTPTSLSLISAERYALLYEKLKRKYGTEIVKIWPENTDPAKFVYEDIGIATYLILLWERERSEKGTESLQSFLDLGCGNGLLVYILSGEGHRGTGIDLRKRKIWDLFPLGTRLEVRTVVPSSDTVFPGVDWIIGNHSDELTPWIPVIAARSSPDCHFFLLPCCAYEFDGTKYQRQCASNSQYSEYIDYVKSISERCGFQTNVDKLRIPSTKRICLVGWRRSRDNEDAEVKERRICEIINSKATLTRKRAEEGCDKSEKEQLDGTGWSCDFKPRDPIEKVRNCTRLDKTLVANIVSSVAMYLLRDGHQIPIEGVPEKTWNAGRCIELAEIVRVIPREMLTRLRKECGGLQTLLKNHGHVFNVARGKVELRKPNCGRNTKPKKARKTNPSRSTSTKPCWFYQNHPDGCPATELDCNFKHVK